MKFWLLSLLVFAGVAWAAPPNVVVIVVDDLGYGELLPGVEDRIPTPNLDALAANGVRFTQAYVTASFCAPSRAALLTGRYQTRFGFEYNPTGAQNEDPRAGLPPEETTLAEHLAEAGYRSGAIGKWHLGAAPVFHPLRQGFDEFYGFLHEGHYYVPPTDETVTTYLRRKVLPGGGTGRWTSADGRLIYSTELNTHEPDYDANNPILRRSQPEAEPSYLTSAFSREAASFIRRHRDAPFFLYLAYNAVHSPMQATAEDMARFGYIEDPQRRIFAAMLASLDDGIGKVIQALREHGLEENTLVFFLSDNGGPTKELTSRNGPLRGGKGQVYEGGLRVPMLCQWKGTLPPGSVYEQPVSSLDIFATAAGVAGHPAPRAEGVNLVPFLTAQNPGSPHESFFWRMGRKAALRSGDWKLLREQGKWELYDLHHDPSETRDLAGENPERVQTLEAQWNTLNQAMKAPVWTP